MNIQKQIKEYIATQSESKRTDMEALHQRILQLFPTGKLWFLNGKDDTGKTVTNPNIGYGLQTIKYAGERPKSFIKLVSVQTLPGSLSTSLALGTRPYLSQTYSATLGKAGITGYCIKFKSLKNININILEAAIRDGIEQTI